MSELRNWILNRAPDLRIMKAFIDDRRGVTAVFTVDGVEHSVGPMTGDDADEGILRLVADALCEALGLQSALAASTPTLQQDIVRASLAGDEATRLALTAEYVSSVRAGNPAQRMPPRWKLQ